MKAFLFTLAIVTVLFGCAKKITSTETTTTNTVKPPVETPKETAKKMESPEVTAGKEIYTTKCARCHGAKKVDDFTAAEWVPILDRMAPKARLDAAEKANVAAYVNFYAKAS